MNPETSQQEEPSSPDGPEDLAATYAQNVAWFAAEVPEYYFDTINISTSNYGMSVTFGVRGFTGPAPKARVFMSHEMALVTSRLLQRVLRTYERDNNVTIQLPESILATLKIRPEDLWELERSAEDAKHDGEDEDGARSD